MTNEYVYQRLTGIQQILMGVHRSGGTLSSASKGTERESFIDSFLSEVLPSPFRFGSGDVTDEEGRKSGQLDVVIEYPFMPSLPIVGSNEVRLYLAESIAAVIEVKSDVSRQWSEVNEVARQLQPIKRNFGATMTQGPPPTERIPLFAVGYSGWKRAKTLRDRLADTTVDGILVIDPGIFVSTQLFGKVEATGPWALWGLISCLHQATSTLKTANPSPQRYAMVSE